VKVESLNACSYPPVARFYRLKYSASPTKHRDHKIIVLSRDPKKSWSALKTKLSKPDRGVTDKASLVYQRSRMPTASFTVCSFLIHPNQNPKRGSTYERVDAEGTENLCETLKLSGETRKLIYFLARAPTLPAPNLGLKRSCGQSKLSKTQAKTSSI